MKLNIIIPMAGESSRFNYKFKPFLYLDNRRFIEHTLDNFIRNDNQINTYNFIITEKQEIDNNVLNTLKIIFPNIANKINVVIITKKTSGPYQTILLALQNIILKDINNVIICDCDHSIDIDPILQKLNNNVQLLIPLWNLRDNEQHNWGKVIFFNKKIYRFCEKEYIIARENQEIYGLIGCYYFKNINLLLNISTYLNISDFLHNNFKKLTIEFVNIKKAYFYGTPEMVENCIKQRRRLESVFCDVDGVLLKHSSHSNDNLNDNKILGDCVNKLNNWREEDKKIILVTARPKTTRSTFEKLLKELNIIYDDIVMGLYPGPRYLINDIKPSNPFVKQAVSLNVIRDDGIDNLLCNESSNYDIEIIKKFKGNSFSNTYLLRRGNEYFVRKHILKIPKISDHCERLKRQYDDLKRFYYYNSNLVPKVLNENDNLYDYFIDIEYLPNHKQLDEYDIDIQYMVLYKVMENLRTSVYCYKKRNTSTEFIEEFFNTKIYPKLNQYENECDVMNYLINSDKVKINNKIYYGLRKIFNKLDIHNFNTEWINPIHGDLTLENILYDIKSDDVKLIDMEGSRYVDSSYFDLGKIFQSIVSNYKEWNVLETVVYDEKINDLKCVDKYFICKYEQYKTLCDLFGKIMEIEDTKLIFNKGIFFMATYFIRFVQFRRKISKQHGIYAIIMAVVWLNNIEL